MSDVSSLPAQWHLNTLPAEALEHILAVTVVANNAAHRGNRSLKSSGTSLFAMFDDDGEDGSNGLVTEQAKVTWATDHYEQRGEAYTNGNPVHDIGVIVPRVEKSMEEQKRRVRSKAEVFTPLWVVNAMNNLVENPKLGKGFFNTEFDDERGHGWTPSEKLVFPTSYPWWKYVAERRMEICCGEGPYLFSPYDPTSGTYVPVRDENGRFRRIGFLDRKLRVAAEFANSQKEWDTIAECALRTTYGYEWQGDNLLLARVNMINTFLDYWIDFRKASGAARPSRRTIVERTKKIAPVVAQQLWQMDGLKQTIPGTCSKTCVSCKKRLKTGHDGRLPAIPWGDEMRPFEDFLTG